MSGPVPVFLGTVDKDGKLRLEGRTLFDSYLKQLKNKSVALVVTKQGRPKTRGQLGYLWSIVYPVIAEHFGYKEYELHAVHDELCRVLRGLKPEPNPLKLRWSLSEQDHEETSRFIEDVRHWALVNHNVVTPDAEKVTEQTKKGLPMARQARVGGSSDGSAHDTTNTPRRQAGA